MKQLVFSLSLLFIAGCTQALPAQPVMLEQPNLPVDSDNVQVDTNQIDVSEGQVQTQGIQQESHTVPQSSAAIPASPVPQAPVVQETYLPGLTLDTPPKLENINEPQDAVFYVGYGWTGGMGDPVLREDDSSLVKQYDGLGIYLKSGSMESILEKGGGLPDCYYDPLMIKVSANVTLVETTDTNYSIEDAPEQSYYKLAINNLYDVLIKADVCDD